jgi:hypothetical protein
MGIVVNKDILDYGCLVVVVIDVFIDAHSGVFPPANELTIQNIVLTNTFHSLFVLRIVSSSSQNDESMVHQVD